MLATSIRTVFAERFNGLPEVFSSPGRINIIGEHTDYNEGFVLPGAIDKAIYIAIGKRQDDQINLYSVEYNESVESSLRNVIPQKNHWANYILGVVAEIQKAGHQIHGFDMVVDGDVPLGAGLSSSAAVECATAFALNETFGLGMSEIEMVKHAQMAEHHFAGVRCGIMDQFASMFGRQDHLIRLDCRGLEYEFIPFNISPYKIVLFNTNVKHSLASTEYNTRREECEKGISWIKEHYNQVQSLRDADMLMLEQFVKPKSDLIFRRCKYVVEENQRLLNACEALKADRAELLGQYMFSTHEGLSKDYEVSCKELDFLVDIVKDVDAVIGARMMGGGFGGCTINLIKEDAVDEVVAMAKRRYESAMDLPFSSYQVSISEGSRRCK